uniref:Uncharacterized protein n=1 Tax=Oryza meridionalis TaxID=40149 RepID=A0A0E0C929_9ORYZ
MEALMVDRVHGSLRLFMHRNAVFLCERLCAQFPAETNVQLLATCYLHNNQPYAAYHILKGKKLPESRYLFAMSCFRMNLLREAEEALSPVNEPNIELHANTTAEVSGYPHVKSTALHMQNGAPSNLSQFDTPSPTSTQPSGIAPPPLFRNMHAYQNTAGGNAPSKPKVNAPNLTLRRKYIDEAGLKKVSGRLFNQSSDSVPRRSARLSRDTTINSNSNISQFGGNGTDHSSGNRYHVVDEMWTDNVTSTSSSTSIVDGRYPEQEKSERVLSQDSKLAIGIRELMALLQTLGEGYRLSCLFKCQEALEVYRKLPEAQFNTGWVLCQVGKTYFELVNYLEADHFFELAHRLSPCTLEGMDIYSTVLYHLNEEMRLSYLAQDLVSIDRLSPQAWCAVGNCFALRKDHETALKNFQRAVQLDSRVAYAHTLCGHEYSALEDYENSIKLYRSALQVDERHYNAWYGLGVVYLRQEKFEFAEHHFRRAFQINPCSSVLMCYLGMALHALKRNEEALEMMEKAIFADKKNPLPKYQKALILLGLQKYPDALDELERLKEIAPHESSMYALMGKIYKQLNILDKAVFCFGIALDLKPPAADVAIIKSAMEKVHLPDELMDDDDDDDEI